MRQPRRDSIQALRALAALMVLFYHQSYTLEQVYVAEGASLLVKPVGLFERFGFAGVDLFFCISGLIMVITCWDQFGKWTSQGPFLVRRATRIYPLYWFVTGCVLLAALVFPALATRDKFEWHSLVCSLLLLPQDQFPVVGVGWTLTYEAFFYVVFAALLCLPRGRLPLTLIVWATLTLGFYPLFNSPEYHATEGILQLPLVASPLVVEFILGCGIGWLIMKNCYSGSRIAVVAGVAGFLYFGIFFHSPVADLEYGIDRLLTYGVCSTLLVYGMVALEASTNFKTPGWIVVLGDASYSVYLTHVYVIYVMKQLVLWAGTPETQTGCVVWSLVCTVACLTCGLGCFWLVERPLLRLTRNWLAAKKVSLQPTVAEVA